MSRRAAARLESFGFDNVCVYTPGKQDWLAFGLPIEGSLSEADTAGISAQKDVPVCRQEDTLSDVHRRIQKSGWQECVVVTEQRIVLGLVENTMRQGYGGLPVEQVMDRAPLTVRPHFTSEAVADKMKTNQTEIALVTTPVEN
jgi:CBS domain-containing protein